MNNNTGNSSTDFDNSTEAPEIVSPSCRPNYNISVHGMVLPAVIIILILAFLNKRVNKRSFLNGRPGLVIPVDILSGNENRFTIAVAFGSASFSVALLFLGQIMEEYNFLFGLPGPWWISAFTSILSVLEIGVLEYPTLACLTTQWKLVGSLTGFAYTLARTVTQIVVSFLCVMDKDAERNLPGYQFIMEVPVYICRLFLLGRFFMLICQHIYQKFCHVYDLNKKSQYEEIKLSSESDIEHVKLLLVSITNQQDEEAPKFHQRMKNAIYKKQSDFKYPIQILAAITVSAVLVYELTIALVVLSLTLWREKQQVEDSKEFVILVYGQEYYDSQVKTYRILFITYLVALLVANLNFIFHIFHLLKCYRNHMIRFYKSQIGFIPESLPTASGLVSLSFRYSGYQVSYLLWGFLISFLLLFAVTGGLAALILLLPHIFSDEFAGMIEERAIKFLPVLGVTAALFVLQKVLAMFVFRNRSIPDNRITIDNRRCFLVFWFFFFFFNIIVGLVSCLLRIVKGMVLGVMFLGRLDRSGIIDGFEKLDKGYMAYLGFLFVQAAHRNPVVLVFLQTLHDGARARGDTEQHEGLVKINMSTAEVDLENGHSLKNLEEAAIMAQERKSKAIRFRWHVVFTLINNPILLHNRRKDVLLAKVKGRKVKKVSHDVEILPI